MSWQHRGGGLKPTFLKSFAEFLVLRLKLFSHQIPGLAVHTIGPDEDAPFEGLAFRSLDRDAGLAFHI